jgi:mRNA interferase RelE/StbE
MSSYRVLVPPRVEKQIARIAEPYRGRIFQALRRLAEDPRPMGSRKLVDHDDAYRIRVGDYRVIYEIEDKIITVTVTRVAKRSEAYR